jgi:TolB-like protein/Flp pilus assembly protein TadD
MQSIPANIRAQLGEQYAFERELVGGGMARVYLAEDKELHRRVVVKVLPSDVASGVSASRFRSEILTVARLQHPHIVGILRAGEVDGVPFFVMPYVDGESLAVHLKRTGPASVRDAVAVFRDVARALAFAHKNGIVHRDIKPGNILLAGGSATVTDFGVAKALSSAMRSGPHEGHVTDTGVSLGTLLYMAPEQAAGDPHIDGRADIYSLGITIYEMLAGQAPFAGLSPREMLTARLTGRPPALSSLRKDIPPRLESLLMRCLEPDPANRPQTADEVFEWLEATELGSGANAISSGAWNVLPGRRKKALTVWLPLAVVLAAGALAYAGTREKQTAPVAGVAAASAPAESEVIAVMPFVSLSDDSSNAYLAAGLTNALASRLSRAAGLSVITPTRAVDYVSASRTQGGKEVFVLEGAVERDGSSLRVSARLSSAETGIMKWSDVFDRDVKDLRSVEDDIASTIVEAVAPRTAPRMDSFNRVTAALPPDIYERYLRAKYDLAQRGPAPIRRAIVALKEITNGHASFAPAFATLAQAYAVLPLYSTAASGDSLRKLALEAANTAARLDPKLADAYSARAAALASAWNWSAATQDFERAIALDSMSARAHQWYGEHLLVIGKPQLAVRELSTAARLDPSSPIIAGSLAIALMHAGRRNDAVKQGQVAVAMDPSFATTHFMYGAVLLYGGLARDAVIPLGEALQLAPDSRTVLGLLGYAQAVSGDAGLARRTLERLERSAPALGREPAIARVKIALGDVDGGLSALAKAAEQHDPFFASEPLSSPPFGTLRGDARFAAIARTIGLALLP